MKKNSISEFELEKQDFKIKLKRGAAASPTLAYEDATLANYSAPALPAPGGTAPSAAGGEIEIRSPMIGTFYRSPSPESGNYVEVGTEVTPEAVVCIIEAMKVM